ncbi:MAG: hypothetical protein PHY43_03980 [Verrucomicrobiales bacterium]|nr:hypothetical protein [Verrucomicrobiales bacterium]
MITIDDVRRSFHQARDKRERFLTEHGWVVIGDFPDRRVRWVKQFGRHEMAMSAGSAFALERTINET